MIIYKSQGNSNALPHRAQPKFDAPTQPLRSSAPTDAQLHDLEFGQMPPLQIDVHAEDAYWAEHYRYSPYLPAGTGYDQVRAAYRFGWESRRRLPDANWSIALPRLRSEWNADPANFMMSWGEAERAVHDAWNHAGAQRHH